MALLDSPQEQDREDIVFKGMLLRTNRLMTWIFSQHIKIKPSQSPYQKQPHLKFFEVPSLFALLMQHNPATTAGHFLFKHKKNIKALFKVEIWSQKSVFWKKTVQYAVKKRILKNVV